MKKTFFVLISLLVIVILLGGCSLYESRLEKDYGNSHRLAIVNQTLNPEAEKNLEPVYGIDGKTTNTIVESFQKSFEERKREPSFPLDVIQIQSD
ncbi:MAG: hypothetical protein ACYSTS_12935 [Planctomycetota bacterium]|jgi:hypothetical protein